MLFPLAILLLTSPVVTALTDLQANCTGTDRLYNGTSCYVIVGTAKTQDEAKTSCNHYLGYSGHLVHIGNAAVGAAVKTLMTIYDTSIPYVWTGEEVINSSAALTDSNNWGNYYRNGTVVSPSYRPWGASQPKSMTPVNTSCNRVYFSKSSSKLSTYSGYSRFTFVCEYEEALKQPVTDLEEKCVNLTSSFYTTFVNDVCYVAHPETKNYNDAKMACNDLSGHKGHLAHVRTIGELWIADALLWTFATVSAVVRLGIEQTNLSSTDPNNGWYLTTPTSPSVLATYLPWKTAPTAGMRTIAVSIGYPTTFNAVANTTLYPFVCQYDNTTLITTTTTTTSTTTTPTTTTTTTPTTTTTATSTTTTPTTTTPTTTSSTTSTTTTTPTTTTTAAGTACNITTPTIPGGTGSIASRFHHYGFGYFTNTCYWLSQSTTTLYSCIYMCYTNELCFGVSYNSGTSDCHLLAIIANELPYSSELIVDNQYNTYIRQRY